MQDHLFISDMDGALYDTRDSEWSSRPLRPVFSKTCRDITNAAELKATLRAGQWAWPGGYPMFFITSDGGALSFKTVREEYRLVLDSVMYKHDDGWRVTAVDINWEDEDLFDCHTSERIESAYGEEESK
jgi:hypothetical protein